MFLCQRPPHQRAIVTQEKANTIITHLMPMLFSSPSSIQILAKAVKEAREAKEAKEAEVRWTKGMPSTQVPVCVCVCMCVCLLNMLSAWVYSAGGWCF